VRRLARERRARNVEVVRAQKLASRQRPGRWKGNSPSYYAANAAYYKSKSRANWLAKQDLSLASATVPKGTPYSAAEVRVLADGSLSVLDKALALGRTYSSVQGTLRLLRRKGLL
jgi:hypothetical protein